jgi:hypothetical protein
LHIFSVSKGYLHLPGFELLSLTRFAISDRSERKLINSPLNMVTRSYEND